MRIWDINAGFLNDKSLLGEHRELHGILSILCNGKKGYSRHPETLRWMSCINALLFRHSLLVEEMTLRKFNHNSPVAAVEQPVCMPDVYIDSPEKQYRILEQKYTIRPPGPLPLPKNIQSLWTRHKYSVMARDYRAYQRFGPQVAGNQISFEDLAARLTFFLNTPPPMPSLRNTLFHMWGYVSFLTPDPPDEDHPVQWMRTIQTLAHQGDVKYLLLSTAIRELPCWCNLLAPHGD